MPKFIDPETVRCSQSSIKSTFKEGGTIAELAESLKSGAADAANVFPVRLMEREGVLFALDNRRMEAFRRAGTPMPYRMATPEEIADESWKFTTRNGGISVRVREELREKQ